MINSRNLNSSRKYTIIGFEDGGIINETISLFTLLKPHRDGYEYIYALQEETDDILDLKVNQTMYVSLNRDNVNFKGVICRIS